jgi:hypothetical protein
VIETAAFDPQVLTFVSPHQVQRLIQKDDEVLIDINWYTASHWMFRWLHRPFNKRLLRLQRQQDLEDNRAIRARRFDLRRRGISFLTDDADFINSNTLTDNVRLPRLAQPARIPLGAYAEGSVHRIECGPTELLVRRRDGSEVELRPAMCPHEGAPLGQRHLRGDVAVCPWHGRCLPAIVLNTTDRAKWRFLTTVVTNKGDHLELSEPPDGQRDGE